MITRCAGKNNYMERSFLPSKMHSQIATCQFRLSSNLPDQTTKQKQGMISVVENTNNARNVKQNVSGENYFKNKLVKGLLLIL